MPNAITLTDTERMELTKRATSRTSRAEDARRARLALLLAEGPYVGRHLRPLAVQPRIYRQLE